MKQKYRIYVLGDIPPDLKERVASIHVAGILKSRAEGMPVHGLENKIHKAGYLIARRV